VTPGDLAANGVVWSLSIEIWLYALSPWFFKTSLKWLKILALLSLGFYFVHDYIDTQPYYHNSHGLAFLGLSWAFLFGFAYYRYPERFGNTLVLVLAGVFLACCLGERFGPINFALVILAVTKARGVKLDRRWRKPLIFAGNLSYPLYLVHVPILDLARGFDYENGIVIACAVLLLALAVRVFIEMPVEWYQRRRRLRLAAA
jgi:peptidoglycan/LPS O-acetylase OafA/YrhL